MLKRFSLGQSRRCRAVRGWTLVEMMVAITAGLIVLAAFIAVTLTLNTSFVAVGNYSDLDKASRYTLDNLTRDIRSTAGVSSSSTTTSLTLTNTFSTTNLITYAWDGSSNVTRTVSTLAGLTIGSPQVMLTSCDYLGFNYFIRIPTNNLQFISITNTVSTNEIKLVSVSWKCSRTVLGSKLNTESVQTANIVVRN